jgi:hypothetical protein
MFSKSCVLKTVWSRALALALGLTVVASFGETVKDRPGAVREDRATMEKDERWIYNDWRRGFAEAKRTGKPLLVVLRCVPCLACAGIDAGVLKEPELAPLLEKFVCVRVINANALDLSLFQFDYDLSFSTMFFNGDGTVYGRYGSWAHQKDIFNKTTEGYKRALESVLAIHRGYPANKNTLKGKQGDPMPVKDPLELPGLAGKYKRELDWDGKIVQSCVHCHQVSDALRSTYRDQKKDIPREWIYPMPTPETIGLVLASDSAARVEKVEQNSIAANAGLQPNDEIVSLEGQPLVSIADVAWILHHAPETGTLKARIKRGTEEKAVQIDLPRDWRMRADISRRVGTWPMRAMATGGILLKELSDEKRAERGLGKDQMALFAEHVGEYGNHAAAKKAGFKKEDVIIEIDGTSRRITESELIGRLLEKHKPGAKIKTTVLRGSERIELMLPMQ